MRFIIAIAVMVGAASALAQPASILQKHGHTLESLDAADGLVRERVFFDGPSGDGSLTGGSLDLVHRISLDLSGSEMNGRRIDTQRAAGDPVNRVDIVAVGDGYQASELDTYATHVQNSMAAFFAMHPFDAYANYFNVHVVEVVSTDSGVDHDPVQGVLRNTALDMGFWCSGIERLLCVDVGAAYAFANSAPEADLVLAIANSSKYGGAGYTSSDLATVAGGNGSAPQVAIHEFGHSLGNLADEYTYGGPQTYSGGEPSAVNVSILDSGAMAAAGTKWADWLGANNPAYDGLHSTFEGANYSEFGIYRPSNNSMMRDLGRPFNHPSVQSLVVQIYGFVDPIDGQSIPAGQTLGGTETVSIVPMQPIGHSLDIQWSLDGSPIPGATSPVIDISTLSPIHEKVLEVVVVDNTPLVQNELARANKMTGIRSWLVLIPGCNADTDANGVVDVNDIAFVIFRLGSTGVPGNVEGDAVANGIVDIEDIAFVIFRLGQDC